MALTHFTRWLGESADVANIDAGKLQGFYEHCLEKVAARRQDKKAGWSLAFTKEVFAVARAWLHWLAEQGTINPPRNLATRFRFGSAAQKIPTWTVDEIQHVIREAPGKLKLALLLMANCGMTQVDVSDLAEEEVDWKQRTITRRRSKTKHAENVPVVTYRLWPLTWQLLKQYRSGQERVLLTESGKPYVRNEMVKGRLIKADGFTSNYAHLKRRLKFRKPLKQLRKTSASLLENHTIKLPSGERVNPFVGCTTLFLGHSPRSMKEKHYAAPPQQLFDEAVLWLGKQLGLA
jgi:integrase